MSDGTPPSNPAELVQSHADEEKSEPEPPSEPSSESSSELSSDPSSDPPSESTSEHSLEPPSQPLLLPPPKSPPESPPEPSLEPPSDPLYSMAQFTNNRVVLQLILAPPVTVSEGFPERVKPGVGEDLHVLGATQTSAFFSKHLQQKFDDIREIKTEPIYVPTKPQKIKHVPIIRATDHDDNAPIKNLLVTGLAPESYHNLKTLKDRITKDTTICIFDEGLGFPETLNETLFKNPEQQPQYILGQVDTRLMWDHEHPEKTKRLRTRLTTSLPSVNYMPDHRQVKNYMISSVKEVPEFQAITPSYDFWLQHKLNNLVFAAVVEPVCVALDCSYNQLAHNTWGARMVNILMGEMETIVANLPELHESPVRRLLMQNDNMRKMCFGRLRNRRGATSKMVLQVRRGLPTDIDFINGYFVRRARQIGIKCPASEFAIAMVKAKHYHIRRLSDLIIPFEVTSRSNFLR